MSTPACQPDPKVPPEASSSAVASPTAASSAAFKFWASQAVSTFRGEGFRAWLYSFEDYCNFFNLTDSVHLREVGSKLCNNVHILHQDMLFETWEEWKPKSKKHFIRGKHDLYIMSLQSLNIGYVPPNQIWHHTSQF
ncbi:hypothetical protein DSO57_1004481 [Entomophthora muscae]|uniref:Uncharacterized protein n=1 Tax=Entomophthora muscae TaxID=34485 RepID=A0ACC2UUD8_9FUNG|nr:hypothetical protein DSO57_1004481 [Entomophthora muscae]